MRIKDNSAVLGTQFLFPAMKRLTHAARVFLTARATGSVTSHLRRDRMPSSSHGYALHPVDLGGATLSSRTGSRIQMV